MIMAKRIVTKIGDVFCAEIDGQYKRFFQYFAIDSTQLNSSVIRVFKRHYPMDYVPVISDIVVGSVEFYAHTMLKGGITANAWYKIGKSSVLVDLQNIIFRVSEDYGSEVTKSERWYIWNLNEPMIFVGKLPSKYYSADLGSIMPYIAICNRLRFGKYTHFYPLY